MTRKGATEPRGQIVSRTELAAFFGVSMPTVDTWVRAGCPVVKRGSKGVNWEFATAGVADWLRDRAINEATDNNENPDAAIERRTRTAAMIQAELKVAEARKQVALVIEFERATAAFAATVQANIMQVPQRVTIRLLGETNEITFKRILREELTAALRQAADADLDTPEDEDDETID